MLSFLRILRVWGFGALLLWAGSVYAEPAGQPTPPSPKEKRLQWVTENGRQDERDGRDRRRLQMSSEERRALRRELHESRKELRPHRQGRPGR